jgi:hypothetical protein
MTKPTHTDDEIKECLKAGMSRYAIEKKCACSWQRVSKIRKEIDRDRIGEANDV